MDAYRRTLIARQLEGYPTCDDLVQGSSKNRWHRLHQGTAKNSSVSLSLSFVADGPSWSWIMLNLLPIHELLRYTALASQSFRIRLQMISDVMDYLSPQEAAAASPAAPDAQ